MSVPHFSQPPTAAAGIQRNAFTLIELMLVVAIIGILAGIILPVMGRMRERARAAWCMNNTKQLALALAMYADDHNEELPYNVGSSSGRGISVTPTSRNWVNGVMTWGLESDNTNIANLTGNGLGPYVDGVAGIFHCPADRSLSNLQRRAGWVARVRSYAMNAMIGDAGDASTNGVNANNPTYRQFFKLSDISKPSDIFAFLDEHPDSIDDGYFINRSYYPEWIDLPASFHDRAAEFSFADGHSALHRWVVPSTCPPALPDGAGLPIDLHDADQTDFNWVVRHMSVWSY